MIFFPFRHSSLSEKFAEQFPQMSLAGVLADFSLPATLGEHRDVLGLPKHHVRIHFFYFIPILWFWANKDKVKLTPRQQGLCTKLAMASIVRKLLGSILRVLCVKSVYLNLLV